MRLLLALGLYLAAVFLGGALIAPWLHAAVASGADQFPALERLAYQPFHRYVNRCFMIIAIVGLWPLGRVAGLVAADTGWSRDPKWRRRLATGLTAGFVTLAIPAIVCVMAGSRVFHLPDNPVLVAKHFGNAVGAAVLVALLEESVFRGVVFGALKKHSSLPVAVGVTSGIYALVHFFERSRHEGDVVWSSGLALLPKMARGFTDWQMIVPGFFSLVVAGVILALAVRVTGNLYFSIGLHAGWIFWLKSFKFFTQAGENSHAWLLGSAKLIDGWAAFFVLLATLVVLRWGDFYCRGKADGETAQGTG